MQKRQVRQMIQMAEKRIITDGYMEEEEKEGLERQGDGDCICDICGVVGSPDIETNVEFRDRPPLALMMCDRCFNTFKLAEDLELITEV